MIGVAAEIGEQEIKLFVKPKAGAALTPQELSDWLAERLAPYQNPRYIVMVDDFERTASQRIMKHKLATLDAAAWDRMAARVAALAERPRRRLAALAKNGETCCEISHLFAANNADRLLIES